MITITGIADLRYINDRLKQLSSVDTLAELTEELNYICMLLGVDPQSADDILHCEVRQNSGNLPAMLQQYGYNRNPVDEYLQAFISRWESLDI